MNSYNVRLTLGYAANLASIHLVARMLPLALEEIVPHLPLPFEANMLFAFNLAYVLSFLCVAIRGCAFQPLRFGALTFSLLCVVSAFILSFGYAIIGNPTLILNNISASLFGIGLAWSFALWQQSLSSEKVSHPERPVALGSSLAAIIFIPSLLCPSSVLLILLAACLAINYTFLGMECSQTTIDYKPFGNTAIILVDSHATGRLLRNLAKYAICIGTIGLTQRLAATMISEQASLVPLYFMYSLSTVIAIGILLAIWKKRTSRMSFNRFYGISIVVVAVAFLLMPFLDNSYRIFAAVLTNIMFMLVSLFMVVTSIDVAKSRSTNPTLVFGALAGMVFLIASLGPFILTSIEHNQGTEGLSQIVVGTMLGLGFLVVAGATLTFSSERKDSCSDLCLNNFDMLDRFQQIPELNEPDTCLQFVKDVTIQQDAIPACCNALRKQYNLTERQTEVMELIARGRDVTRIAETLCVSYHTARSHCRNLYTKLGVHKRQEILDLLEQERQKL